MTLIELSVSVAASGVLLLSAALLFESLGASAERHARSARLSTEQANGDELLRELLRRVEHRENDDNSRVAARFTGGPTELTFDSLCDMPGGWRERCRMFFGVSAGGAQLRAEAVARDGAPAVGASWEVGLLSAAHATTLLYLEDARNGGRWRHEWEARGRLPLAIGVVSAGDTAIFRVGAVQWQ